MCFNFNILDTGQNNHRGTVCVVTHRIFPICLDNLVFGSFVVNMMILSSLISTVCDQFSTDTARYK